MRKHFLLLFLMALLPLAGWGQKDLGLEVLTGTTYEGSAAADAPVISVTTPTMGLEMTTETEAGYYYTVTYHESALAAKNGSGARELTNLTPGTYYVRVSGHGSYNDGNNAVELDGHYNYAAFTVAKADLTITRKDYSYEYGAKAVTALTYADFAEVSGGKPGDTFTIDITGNSSDNVGTYNIDLSVPAAITNKYNITYAGVSQPKLRILQKSISALTAGNIADIDEQTYSGSAINPSGLNVTATLLGVDNTPLVEGTDYTLSYLDADYTNVGEKTITLNGIGNFSGTTTKNFNIIAKSLTNTEASATVGETVEYNGSEKNPGLVVTVDDKTLTLGSDYTVTWKRGEEDVTSLVDAGDYTATITFEGNYSGSITSPAFTISKATATLTAPVLYGENEDARMYNGAAQAIIKTAASATGTGLGTIKYKVGEGDWYDAIDAEGLKQTAAGTYTVYYKMEEGANYNEVDPASVSAEAIVAKTIEGVTITIPNQTFTGSALTPDLTVTDGTAPLTKDIDYEYADADWASNIDAGNSASVTIHGIGNYTGNAVQTFTIDKKAINGSGISFANVDVAFDADHKTYNGSAQEFANMATGSVAAADEVVITYGTYNLVKGTDYTITYENNTNAGVNTASVIFNGKGNFEGTKVNNFSIAGKPVALTAKVEPATVGYGAEYTPGVTWGDGVTADEKFALGDITYSYKVNNAGTEGAVVAKPSEVGKYFVYANFVNPNTNYAVTATKGEFEITAGQVIASISATATYGSLPTFTLTHVSGLSPAEAATFNAGNLSKVTVKKDGNIVVEDVAPDAEGLKALAVGIYDLEATASCGDSYTVIVSAGKLNVSAKNIASAAIVVTTNPAAIVYNNKAWGTAAGNEIEFTVNEISGIEEADYDVTYSNNVNAGTATITLTGKRNYAGTKTQDFTIKKANLTITADNFTGVKAWTYGKDEPTYTATVTGYVDGDFGGTLDGIEGTLKVKRTSNETVGMHTGALVAGFYDANDNKIANLEATNYDLAFIPGDLQVVKGAVVIQLKKAVTATYGADPATSINAAIKDIANYEYVSGLSELEAANFASFINVGAATYELGAATKYEVGNDYTFTIDGATSTNYGVTINPGTYNVTAADITLYAKDQTINWSDTDPDNDAADTEVKAATVTIAAGKLKYTDALDDVVASIVIESQKVGANNISLTAADNANYNITVNSDGTNAKYGVLTVTGAPAIALSTADADLADKLASYNGKAMPVTIDFTARNGRAATWKANTWNTLVLPFDISVADLSKALGYAIVNVIDKSRTEISGTGSKFYGKLTMKGGNGSDNVLKANKPFMVKTADDISGKINFGTQTIVAPATDADRSVDADKDGYVKFIGTYATRTVTPTDNQAIWFLIGNNDSWLFIGKNGSWDVLPFEGYIDMSNAPAGAHNMTFYFEELNGSTTAIKGISTDELNGKMAEGMYNMNGMKLNSVPTQKGIYILNGKKVVIK